MEGLGVAANIFAIIHAVQKVVVILNRLHELYQDAPSGLRILLTTVTTLQPLVEDLELQISTRCTPSPLEALTRQNHDQDPITGCKRAIQEIEDILPSLEFLATKSRFRKLILLSKWLLKEQRVKVLLSELDSYIHQFNFALKLDTSKQVRDIKMDTEDLLDTMDDNEKREILNWLLLTDPTSLHEKSQDCYEPGTGEWVFRCPEWKSWLKKDTPTLWISGIPGAGKTVLVSHLIERVKAYCEPRPKYACVYYYCFYGHAQDEAAPFLRWVLLELCRNIDNITPYLRKLYRRAGQPTPRQLISVLVNMLGLFEKVYIIIDALDESLERASLLRVLSQMASQPEIVKRVRLLATSREYVDIEEVMKPISKPISMTNEFLTQDIEKYARARVNDNPRIKKWPESVRDEVVSVLSSQANGMFRWVVCQLAALERLRPEPAVIHAALSNLPRTLYETYERAFAEVPEDARVFVRHVLSWIRTHRIVQRADGRASSDATAPCCRGYGLNLAEVSCEILFRAVRLSLAKEDPKRAEELERYVWDAELLREWCGCFLSVSRSEVRDWKYETRDVLGEVEVVSFAHYTAVEFLESERLREGPAAVLALDDKNEALKEHAVILFDTAAASAPRWGEMVEDKLGPEIYTDFDRYCVFSAAALLYRHAQRLISSSSVLQSEPWFGAAARFLEACPTSTMGNYFWSPTEEFRGCPHRASTPMVYRAYKVKMLSPSPLPHLPLLLRLLQANESGYLARGLLESLGRSSADLASVIDIKFSPCGFFLEVEDLSRTLAAISFQGTALEYYAQLTPGESPDLCQGLYDMLDYAAGQFDPSTIMLYVTANHHISHFYSHGGSCPSCRLIKRLLQLGAKSTVPGYAVGALQIAAAMWDLEAVRLLLEAGVDPNDMGDPQGEIGTPSHCPSLRGLQQFRGRSPLNIANQPSRTCCHSVYSVLRHAGEVDPDLVRQLLMQHGGRDFITAVNIEKQNEDKEEPSHGQGGEKVEKTIEDLIRQREARGRGFGERLVRKPRRKLDEIASWTRTGLPEQIPLDRARSEVITMWPNRQQRRSRR